MFTHNRKSIDLNGTWKFNPDPYQRCKQQKWWEGEGTDTAFFPCFNLEGLWDIQVPGTWKTQFEELKWYDGDANYVREFDVDEIPEGHEAFLCFDGVVYACQVYLNGEHVGDHDWGYSPFQLRVTDQLRRQNRLFVLVDNHLREDRVPGVRFDWNNDGGIINGVKLVFVPSVHVHNFRTQTRLDDGFAVISYQLSVTRHRCELAHDPLTVTFAIPELGIRDETAVPVNGTGESEVRIPLTDYRSPITDHSLTLWSPDDPKLYTTTLSTPYETLTDEIGYREIRTEGTQILLNGEPIRLYGVAVHSEFPGTGRTATPDGIDLMLSKARELGCNFLRCAHYPYADIFARAMDKAGMLWWEEVPVYWLPEVHTEPQRSLALGMLREAITRDWNRASLIFWSVSNECAIGKTVSETIEGGNYPYWVAATRLVRELDPSRLVSSADSSHRITVTTKWTPDKGDAFDENGEVETSEPGHPDAFYDLLDVLGGNLYVPTTGANPAATHKFADMLKRYGKPLMLTEFGAMSTTDPRPDCPEDACGHPRFHEQILREAYIAFHDRPEIVGYVPWSLMDVRVPMHWRWYNRGSATFAYGFLDNDYVKKHVFGVVQEEIAKLRARFGDSG